MDDFKETVFPRQNRADVNSDNCVSMYEACTGLSQTQTQRGSGEDTQSSVLAEELPASHS